MKDLQDLLNTCENQLKQQEKLEKEYNACVKHLKLVELHSNSKDEIIEKQQKLSELYKELATLYRDRFDYNNSASEIERLWEKIKELENDSKRNI